MLKDELMTKKDLYKIYEEKFNELWYNGAKEQIFKWVSENVASDGGLINCHPYSLLYISRSTPYRLDSDNQYYFFYFLKSKLWNEGINLLIDEYCGFYMSIRYDGDKYNDMFIIRGELKRIDNIGLINVAKFANMTVEQVYEKFVELDEKRNNATTNVSNNTSNNVSKSKNSTNKKKRNNKKFVTFIHDTTDAEILTAHDIKDFDNDGDEIIKELKKSQDDEKEVLK